MLNFCSIQIHVPTLKWVDGHKGVFNIAVRAISSVHTQVNNLCFLTKKRLIKGNKTDKRNFRLVKGNLRLTGYQNYAFANLFNKGTVNCLFCELEEDPNASLARKLWPNPG